MAGFCNNPSNSVTLYACKILSNFHRCADHQECAAGADRLARTLALFGCIEFAKEKNKYSNQEENRCDMQGHVVKITSDCFRCSGNGIHNL